MVFVITNSTGKRIKKEGKTTPAFDYAIQAQRYIDKKLGGSKYAQIKKVGKKK